jgi:iron-sulfur cluster assembly protein
MGTFHDTNDPLHGVTVAVAMNDRVVIGRCHERDAERVLLLDADVHADGQDDLPRDEYLARAARFGVWAKHDRLSLPAGEVLSIEPLSSFYTRPGSNASPEIAATPQPAAEPETTVAAPTVEIATEVPATARAAVNLTPAAIREVKRLIEAGENEGPGLRLGVAGGGCSGLTYKIEFSEHREGDVVVEHDGFEVYLDPKSSIYLRDVTLDYQGGLGGKGFQFSNPNASNTCGCGESFAV